MAEVDDRQLALARARAEQERRRRARPQAEEAAPEKDSLWQKAGNIAAEINTGILSMIPGARDLASKAGIGYPSGVEPTTAVGRGARYLGMAAPMAVGIPALGARAVGQGASAVAPLIQPGQGIMRNIGSEIARTTARNPGVAYGAEAAGAFGAGAAGGLAEEGGAGPTGQMIAETVGGMGLGGVVPGVSRGARGIRDSVRANLMPMTEEGGMVRASRQVQERAGGPQGSREAAERLEGLPEGVTPAQWIGNERLMAQEARLLADNPELERQVKNELEDARLTAQNELRDMFGNPRSRQDWEYAVLESVTPEGAVIPRGQTDEMLDAAYQSFAPLYDQAKGHDIPIPRLSNVFKFSSSDPDIIAEPPMRAAVDSWLQNQLRAYGDDIGVETASSDVLLDLRSRLRRERRMQSKRGNLERADLIGGAEAELTKILENGLPDDVVETLRSADSQYRRYKIVEDAVYNAGDSQVTPEQLSQSIRMGGMTTPSRYARGADEVTQEMRQLALAGRSTEEVLGDPRRAAQFVRDLPDNAKKAVQADFMDTLFQRATRDVARDATEAGTPFASGSQLVKDLTENREVMKSLGMGEEEISRAFDIARQIRRMEERSPAAVANLLEDGPASLFQLGAALIGAKSGQRLAGGGFGSSLVMAQYMSNKTRGMLAAMTSDTAAQLMQDAVRDPDLYRALLTRDTQSRRKQREAARYVESYLMASAADKAINEEAEQ